MFDVERLVAVWVMALGDTLWYVGGFVVALYIILSIISVLRNLDEGL